MPELSISIGPELQKKIDLHPYNMYCSIHLCETKSAQEHDKLISNQAELVKPMLKAYPIK